MMIVHTLKELFSKKFNPFWFVSIMGTGITSSVLFNFPYEAHWLRVCGIVMFAITCVLLVSTTFLFLMDSLCYPDRLKETMFDLKRNVFIGCYAMGFQSWANMIYFIWGKDAVILCYSLWWVSSFLSLFTAWIVLFILMKKTTIESENISPTLLLPVVPLTVVASAGGLLYSDLPDSLKISTLVISFLFWANSMLASFLILSSYFYKVLIYKIPSKSSVFTSFIPIGFLGQGAFAIQLFGSNFYAYKVNVDTNPAINDLIEGSIFKYTSVFIALFLETGGFFFTFISIVSCFSYGFIKPHKGWWAITFPLGTMALATNETFKIMNWPAFRVLSAMYGTVLTIITILCLIFLIVYQIFRVQANKDPETVDLEKASTLVP